MLTADPPTESSRAPALARAAPDAARPHGARLLVLASVALAGITLLAPSAPTYDPWAWIVWGREITQLDLNTVTGPSWKPLPVLFTTLFAPFGEAAPSLWLVVARAGAVAAVVLAYALGRALGAARPAAAAAAAALATAPWWTVNAWMGNSEGLLVACLLGACLAHLGERRRLALALAVAAGLLRPEVWPFLVLYGLWLLRTDRGARPLVLGGGALLPLLWLVPEQLGSGDLWRASSRAQTDLPPDSPGATDAPALEILRLAWELLPLSAWVGVFVALGVAGLAVRRGGRGRRVVALAALAGAWVALVAVMAGAGYSGNERYLIAPVAALLVLAGVGATAVLERLPRLLVPAAAAGLLLLLALPGARESLDARAETAAQSRLPGDLEGAVGRAGGRDSLLGCGTVVTEPLLVPQVAWRLGLHLEELYGPPRRGDALVFRAQVSPHLRPYPGLDVYAGLPQRTLATAPRWRILVVGRCAR